jgi:hypothetical protein
MTFLLTPHPPWIDAHELKIQGRGYLMFFAKIPRGVKAFKKNYLGGGPPISGFIAFLLTSILKFAWGGSYIYPPPPPTSSLLCASMPPCDIWWYFGYPHSPLKCHVLFEWSLNCRALQILKWVDSTRKQRKRWFGNRLDNCSWSKSKANCRCWRSTSFPRGRKS